MKEPLKAGDRCLVIDGFAGARSASIGREVIVQEFRGEHSRFGPMWRCRSADGKSLSRVDGNNLNASIAADQSMADFARSWLRKADEPPPAPTSTTTDREVTA
jgi:hypothetical protein